MLRSVTAVAVLVLASAKASAISEVHPLSDEFISAINSEQDYWTAGRNFPVDTPISQLKRLLGALQDDHETDSVPVLNHDDELIAQLPNSFHPKEKWPNCKSLDEIRNQGNCGSCWAFGAVEVMTDRICIYSNGTKNFHYSAQDLMTCCASCRDPNTDACQGGYPNKVFKYWKSTGIVSGGEYDSHEGCRPYQIDPNSGRDPIPQRCVEKCEPGYNIEYKNDRHFSKSVNAIIGEDNMKAELFKNGPIECGFTVYVDFMHYRTGVYKHVKGGLYGHHAVKMLGWGEEKGVKYWLLANSWGPTWGEEGFFKVLRGSDECDIETQCVTGEPAL